MARQDDSVVMRRNIKPHTDWKELEERLAIDGQVMKQNLGGPSLGNY